MHYLVTYDAREKKRLQKVFRLLSSYALPLQESVLIFVGDAQTFDVMKAELCDAVNLKQDDIRLYKLTRHSDVWKWDYRSRREGLFIAL